MPKYIIQKTGFGCNYFYNLYGKTWEGLRGNASPLEPVLAKLKAQQLHRIFPNEQVTVKIIKQKQ